MLGPAGSSRLWIVAVVIVAGIGILFSGMLRRDRLCRFWAVGSMLCLLPICATFPLDRLLFFVGIGAMGLLARFIADSTGGPGGEGRGRKGNGLRRLAVFFVVGVHLVVAPLVFPLRAAFPGGPPDFVRQVELRTPLDASVEVQDLIVINAPSPIHVCYSLAIREAAGLPLPRRMRVLAPAFPTIAVTREDERTLVIRPAKGFLPWKFDRLFRPRERPMRVGQHVSLTGLDIEVSAVLKDGTPTEAVFRFSVPLEDPSLRWLYWREGEFVAFTPPLVGERIELRGQLPTGL
jgi:hypothetical protein